MRIRDFHTVGTPNAPMDISGAEGLCVTYTADNDVMLQVINPEINDDHCFVTLPATDAPTMVDHAIEDFEQPSWATNTLKEGCIKAFKAASTISFRIEGNAEEIQGKLRIFEVGPKGTCLGNKTISDEEPNEFCHKSNGKGLADQQDSGSCFVPTATHTVTFMDEDGNIISKDLIKKGKIATAPENTSRKGYTFLGWFEKDSETAWDFATPVKKDIELYEKWAVSKYTIKVSVNDSKMGSVKGAGEYEYGTEVELVATAADGYKFSNWKDDAKAAATRKVKVTADASYKANFEKIADAPVEDQSSSSSVIVSDSEGSRSSSSKKTDAKSSSSSSAKASSSSSKKVSSSSAKKDAIVATAAVPQFSVAVMGRNVQIAGAMVGAKVAVFDMQGGLITTGRVDDANFSVAMPRSGSYMVRIGSQTKRVNVK